MNKRRDRVIWDKANRDHIVLDHPERLMTTKEVSEALEDPDRIEIDDPTHGSVVAVGLTEAGRPLVVAWRERGQDGMYPIHARQAGKRELAEYENQ